MVHFLSFLWYTILMDTTHGGDGPTLAAGGPTDAVGSEWGQALPPPAQARVLLDAIGDAEDLTAEGLTERILRHVEVRPLIHHYPHEVTVGNRNEEVAHQVAAKAQDAQRDTGVRDYSPATGVRAHCPNCGAVFLLLPEVVSVKPADFDETPGAAHTWLPRTGLTFTFEAIDVDHRCWR